MDRLRQNVLRLCACVLDRLGGDVAIAFAPPGAKGNDWLYGAASGAWPVAVPRARLGHVLDSLLVSWSLTEASMRHVAPIAKDAGVIRRLRANDSHPPSFT